MSNTTSTPTSTRTTPSNPSTPQPITNAAHLQILNQISSGATTTYTMMWGRTAPYAPTQQTTGNFRKWKGKPPTGISDQEWDRAFNNAHTKIYEAFGGRTGARSERAKVVLYHALREGAVRDRALHVLWKKGLLPAGFVDRDY